MEEPSKLAANQPLAVTPVEPVLPMSEIQGIVVPGFFKPHQTLLGIVCGEKPERLEQFKRLLLELSKEISTASQTLNDRREFRASRMSKAKKPKINRTLIALALSYSGLKKLTLSADAIPSNAFRQGMAARSTFLGDPTDPKNEGSPLNWKVGGHASPVDALIVVAGDARSGVDHTAERLARRLTKAGLNIVYRENGDVRSDDPGHEHFGFDDGISQPGIRGRATDAPDDFITPRHIAAAQHPEHSLFGYPGQDLVWPGVLLLGHSVTSPDPLIPGTELPAVPDWTRNGSFLVFRRLRQDVRLFWRTMNREAQRLSALPGFAGMTAEKLASRIVGRWKSGAPVNRVPAADDPTLGSQPLASNHFRFDSDATVLPLNSGYVDPFPQSKADPAGTTCPWAAHIRKVNTRDSGTDTGGRDSTYIRRLLRVGVPFGKSLKDPFSEEKDDPQKGNRGLLFLSIQSSIEDQFEFLMARWMGDSTRPKTPGGHDVLVGQNDTASERRIRKCVIFGSGLQQSTVATSAQWIIPTGGEYFFVPSLTALLQVIGSSA